MLHEALAPVGIYASHTVVVGPMGLGEQHEPADIAEQLWQRYAARDEAMTVIR